MEALDQWIASQARLKAAVSDFLNACTALKDVALQPLASRHSQLALENVLDQVQSRINSIDLFEHQLQKSHTALNVALNLSTSRVPIQRLPSEILSSIFLIAAYSPRCSSSFPEERYPLLDIQLACVRWRQVATNTPLLWSHIDVNLLPPSKIAGPLSFEGTRPWLDRSQGVPVHLHVEAASEIRRGDVSKLASVLPPHADLIQSLSITGNYTAPLVQAILDLCSNHGISTTLKSLALTGIRGTREEGALLWSTYSFLRLTELDLKDMKGSTSPPLGDLVNILSNCPTLHTLKLQAVTIIPDRRNDYLVIPLPQLRILEFSTFDNEQGLSQLLPLLSPGSYPLDVRIDILLRPRNLAPHFQSFLARSNATYLVLQNAYLELIEYYRSLFPSIPHLRVLVLYLSPFDRLEIFEQLLAPTDQSAHHLPLLQCVCLNSGNIGPTSMNRLEQILEARHIHTLAFRSCRFSSTVDYTRNDNIEEADESTRWTQEIPLGMLKRLSKHVGRVVVRNSPSQDYGGVDLFTQELMASCN